MHFTNHPPASTFPPPTPAHQSARHQLHLQLLLDFLEKLRSRIYFRVTFVIVTFWPLLKRAHTCIPWSAWMDESRCCRQAATEEPLEAPTPVGGAYPALGCSVQLVFFLSYSLLPPPPPPPPPASHWGQKALDLIPNILRDYIWIKERYKGKKEERRRTDGGLRPPAASHLASPSGRQQSCSHSAAVVVNSDCMVWIHWEEERKKKKTVVVCSSSQGY